MKSIFMTVLVISLTSCGADESKRNDKVRYIGETDIASNCRGITQESINHYREKKDSIDIDEWMDNLETHCGSNGKWWYENE